MIYYDLEGNKKYYAEAFIVSFWYALNFGTIFYWCF